MLSIDDVITVLDSVAAGVDVLSAAMAEIRAAARANRDLLVVTGDTSVQTQLTTAFDLRATLVETPVFLPILQGAMLQRALDRHYGGFGLGGLNAFLGSQSAQVHPNLKLIGMQIDSRNTFAPTAVDPAGSYEGAGAGVGVFVAGSTIDTTKYGDTSFELVVDHMGGTARTVRVTFRKFDESSSFVDLVIPADAPADTVVDIPDDRYVGVTNIETIAGGEAADLIHVRSMVERLIAL